MLRSTLVVVLLVGATASTRFHSLNRLSEQEDAERQQKCGMGKQKKVFNGDRVKNFTFVPYAALFEPPGCSATLISKRHILTAAHCAMISKPDCSWRDHEEDFKNTQVVLRSLCRDPYDANEYCSPRHENGVLLAKVKTMILPSPYYSLDENCYVPHNDIMIIELENDIENEEDVEYACLSPDKAREGLTVRISGYGDDNNHTAAEPFTGVLKTFTTNITKCSKTDAKEEERYADKMCAINNNYRLACPGDSGSGVISNSPDGRAQVEGILIAGVINCYELMEQEEHFRKNPTADILTSTFHFLDWICFVTGICPREQDRQMVSNYLNNQSAPHPEFILLG